MTCISSITVTPSTVTLKKGEWYYNASAAACPADADCKCVRWHSDNTSVATVNATSGYIYAKAAGTAKIYACSSDGSGKSDYITVTVLNTVPVGSVTLSTNGICLEKDQCYTLSATVCPANASNKSLYWTSNNPNVANVDGGVVCALSGGTATIKAIAADGTGVFDTCVVTVTEDILVSSITLDNQSLTMNVGQSQYLHATVCPENATNKNVTWTSSNTSVATVNPNSGLVCAQNAGSATIYATAMDTSNTVEMCNIKVIAYTYPTDKRKMSQGYSSAHKGIDIADSTGKPVYAFADGIVAYKGEFNQNWHPSDPNPPYSSNSRQTMGNYIVINHYNPDKTKSSGEYARTIYMHMKELPIPEKGESVKAGQIIGYIGNTGRSSGSHLHFALSVGDLRSMKPGSSTRVTIDSLPMVNPRVYLPEYY